MPYWDHKRRRRKNCVSFFCDPYFHPQTVWKVSARVVKSVPHYRGDYEFSILTGGTFTFKTVPPDCLKSLDESRKVCTPLQGRQRIFNPHWGYFYFSDSLPQSLRDSPGGARGGRIPRTPFGRFAPSLVAFSASFWGLYESVISMILTVWRL